MILIDNYDSFTYNIVQYLRELGVEPKIFKNDEISIEELKKLNKTESFSSIIISPGPGNPDTAGISMEVIGEFYKTKKSLAFALDTNALRNISAAKVVKAKEPCHGKVSQIYFEQGEKLFAGIEQGFDATRYHSLVVDNDSITKEIKPLAYTKDEILMALKHKDYPVYGVQFHPEAILTEFGKQLIANFLTI